MASFIVKDQNNNVIPGSLAFDGDHLTVRFFPDPPLQKGQVLTVTVTTEVEGESGDHLPADFTYSFSLIPAEPVLAVVATDPSDGSTDVPLNTPIDVRFNKPINPATVTV